MKKERKELRGVFTVMVTPFTEEGRFDEAGFRKNIDWQIEKGIAGLCVAGSTGEFVCLSHDERKLIAKTAVDHVNGRVPVIVGTAAATTAEVIALTKHAEEIGADAVMIINPYYSLPAPNEVIEFFRMVGEAVDIPIMAYNNPACSGVDIKPETMGKIAGFKNIEYLKDASGEIRRVREIQEVTGGTIKVFNGADDLAFEAFVLGAVGWICVCGNIIPSECQRLFDLVQEGKIIEAKKLYDKILPLLNHIEGCGKLVQATKAGVEMVGGAAGKPRLPRLPLDGEERERLRGVLGRIGVI